MAKKKVTGGIMLVSGTSIGAGMIALPLATAQYGAIGSITVCVICWLFMYFTGLLLLEVNLSIGKGKNFISMVEKTLGSLGKAFVWVLYLLLMYSLLTAYISGISSIIQSLIYELFSLRASGVTISSVVIIVFGLFLVGGVKYIDILNRASVVGLVASYVLIVTILLPKLHVISMNDLSHLGYVFLTVPVVLTAFGFHVVIPSLHDYYEGDKHSLKKAILLGSLAPLIVYVVWQVVVMSLFGVNGAHVASNLEANAHPSAALIKYIGMQDKNAMIVLVFKVLALFAIGSSFFGISLGLSGFLADGLKIKEGVKERTLLTALVLILPYLFNMFFPNEFLPVLACAGIILIVLQGLLPALMAFNGRRKLIVNKGFQIAGGTISLVGIMALSAALIAIDVIIQWHK